MQPSSTKKIVAAVSAVMQFLQEEEAVVGPAPTVPVLAPVPVFTPWGMAGRQDAMLFRTLWQRRLGRGC